MKKNKNRREENRWDRKDEEKVRGNKNWGMLNNCSGKRHPQTNPWKLWMVLYMAKKKKKKTVQAWLRILRWWDYPGLSKYNHIYFIRRQKEIWHRQKKVNWPQRQRLEGCSHKPINPGGSQKLEEVRHAFSPGTSRGRTALPTPYFSPALLIWDFWPLWL